MGFTFTLHVLRELKKVLDHANFHARGHSTTTWTEFCHFLTLPPSLRGQFLYLERGQKQTIFDSLLPPAPLPPPHLVHVVIEWPLTGIFYKFIRDLRI